MIKVHYPHPPRKWDFYKGLLIRMAVINLPLVIAFALWMAFIPLELNLLVAFIATILRIVIFWRSLLVGYITEYDSKLDKSKDISYEMRTPSATLVVPIQLTETFGFSRLGEASAYFGTNSTPTVVWYLVNESRDVTCELFELAPLTPYFAGFSTWFAQHRLVITMYPFGDSIRYDDFRSEGINTSLEAAYNYHSRQVAEFESMYGAPVKFDSLDDVRRYHTIFVQKHQPRLHSALNLRRLFLEMIATVFINALVFGVLSMLYLAREGVSMPIKNLITVDAVMSLIYVGFGFLMLLIIRTKFTPSRSIQQAKKQEA
jgi:hypothetical protein